VDVEIKVNGRVQRGLDILKKHFWFGALGQSWQTCRYCFESDWVVFSWSNCSKKCMEIWYSPGN
jgi:hypothetical protein